MPTLYDSLKVGEIEVPNRMFMAPLTRLRGTVDHLPGTLQVEYYTQRAGAGLIISEGTPIDPMAVGYPQVPGLWDEQRMELWQPVVDAVHRAGGRIFCQIWHVGRVSDPTFLDGKLPIAPSALAAPGHVSVLRPERAYVTPRALEPGEIAGVIQAFRRGAELAKQAGFDGVEIHGANGYLLDQFLHAVSNTRTDKYGGGVENRARLMLEVADAVCDVWGPGRVGMHLAPRGDTQGMGADAARENFTYVATELGKRRLAFLMAREYEGPDWLGPELKQAFGGVYVANEKFTRESAERVVADGEVDAVAFGKLFIANPDLPKRFQQQAELNEWNQATFYTHGAEGYVDYPVM